MAGTRKQKSLSDRSIDAAREAGADMSKDEFARIVSGLAKPKPEKKPEPDQSYEHS